MFWSVLLQLVFPYLYHKLILSPALHNSIVIPCTSMVIIYSYSGLLITDFCPAFTLGSGGREPFLPFLKFWKYYLHAYYCSIITTLFYCI
jgi:hypothetical protein